MFLGWSSTKLLFFVPVGYSIWLPGPIICSDWLKFQVEDHPRNIPAKFGSNRPSSFGVEAWNVKSLQTTDDGRQVMAIVPGELKTACTFFSFFFFLLLFKHKKKGVIKLICSDWLKFQRSSSLNPNGKWMIIGMSFTKLLFFMPIGNRFLFRYEIQNGGYGRT
jgi:hypothetical protein